jgi:hypothetical protein
MSATHTWLGRLTLQALSRFLNTGKLKTALARVVWGGLTAVVLVACAGCMTSEVVCRAKGKRVKVAGTDLLVAHENYHPDGEPHCAYYFWLPLSVPADVATSPIQAILIGSAYLFSTPDPSVTDDKGAQPSRSSEPGDGALVDNRGSVAPGR